MGMMIPFLPISPIFSQRIQKSNRLKAPIYHRLTSDGFLGPRSMSEKGKIFVPDISWTNKILGIHTLYIFHARK